MSLWITGVVVAGLIGLVAWGAVTNRSGPAESEFLERVRVENPKVSLADASDQELLTAGRATCRPENLSISTKAWLERLDIDVEAFRDAAAPLCPSR